MSKQAVLSYDISQTYTALERGVSSNLTYVNPFVIFFPSVSSQILLFYLA
jgi:hypothetical protein